MANDDLRKKMLGKFKEEADKHLLSLQNLLVKLEKDPTNPEYLKEIFRNAHTIKGNANLLKMTDIGSIAHKMEDIFGEMREGHMQLQADTNDLLFEACDTINTLLEGEVRGQPVTDINVADINNRLAAILKPEAAVPAPVAPPMPVANPTPATPANPMQAKMLAKFKEEADTHLLSLQNLLVKLEREPNNGDYLKEIFRNAHTIKGNANLLKMTDIGSIAHKMEDIFGEMREGRMQLQADTNDLLFEAVDTINTLLDAAVQGKPATGIDVTDINNRLGAVLGTAPTLPVIPVQTVEPAVIAPAQTQPVLRKVGLSDTVISVGIEKLDELMTITGELVLGKMEAEATLNHLRGLQELLRRRQRLSGPVRNIVSAVGRDPSEFITWQEMRETLTQLNEIDQQVELLVRNTLRDYEEHTSQLVNRVDELESNVKSVRMLPIQTLYDTFPILVRETARGNKLDSALDFSQYGGEIELDKKVLEGIKDPLVHIVNNALTHGIKPAKERTADGKPPAGKVIMKAFQDGGFVSISVSDDGKGIDPAAIRQKAIEKRFLTEAKAYSMSDADIINVIFEPGFSTADIITDYAGRGVGMEVAKINLERLGGQVHVVSEKGKGTTTTLRVPVTLATSRALLVRVGSNLYAMLAPSIEAMLYLQAEDIMSREGRDHTFYRNSLVPLVKLEDLLGTNRRQDHPLFQYQASHSERLQVAGMNIRIGPDSNNGGYFNGNNLSNRDAVMGDGFVGLTLADPRARAKVRELQDNSRERRLGQFPYERLPAVVVGSGDRRVCLLVDELIDEAEIVLKSLSPLLAKIEHVNSATIMGDGQVVMILDIPNLINAARNVNRSGVKKKKDKQVNTKRILVVDDSITTRELERSILEAQGYTVNLADDGTVALDILSRDNAYDLVISDVEMPNMNGFELTTRIKGSASTRHIPVIIVTSLNNEEHKRRGIDAGAQAYITKGDFEQVNLLSTIEYLTS